MLCYPDTRGLNNMGWTRSSYSVLQNNSSAHHGKAPHHYIYEPIYTFDTYMLCRVWALRATWMSYDMIPRDWAIYMSYQGWAIWAIEENHLLRTHACLPCVIFCVRACCALLCSLKTCCCCCCVLVLSDSSARPGSDRFTPLVIFTMCRKVPAYIREKKRYSSCR